MPYKYVKGKTYMQS